MNNSKDVIIIFSGYQNTERNFSVAKRECEKKQENKTRLRLRTAG